RRAGAVVYGGLECSVASAQEYTDVTAGEVCHGEIQIAVSVEITHHHREGKRPGAVVYGGSERPIAVTQEHTYARDFTVLCAVGIRQVALCVAIAVFHCHVQRRWLGT